MTFDPKKKYPKKKTIFVKGFSKTAVQQKRIMHPVLLESRRPNKDWDVTNNLET